MENVFNFLNSVNISKPKSISVDIATISYGSSGVGTFASLAVDDSVLVVIILAQSFALHAW
jgi:hypothetical protein